MEQMSPHGRANKPSISLSPLLGASFFTFIHPLLLQSPFQCLSPLLHFHPLFFSLQASPLFLDITRSIALPLKTPTPPPPTFYPFLSAALMHGKQWRGRRRREGGEKRKKRVINVFEKKINNHRRLGAGSWP